MKFRYLFTKRLWTVDTTRLTARWNRIVRFTRLLSITLDTFAENRMGFQCVALSYYVAFATVPFIAFFFAVTDGFGIEDKITPFLYSMIPNNPEIIDIFTDKAQNILDSAMSGLVGAVGALTFMWAIVWLMFQVERVFNNVWGIRKIPRKLYKRFSFYLLVLVLSPFLIVIFGSGIAVYTNLTSFFGLYIGDWHFIGKLLGWIGFYGIVTFALSIMYKFIPAVKVRYLYAFKSALVAAIFFLVFQYLYLQTQLFVSRMNGVYGAIAAVPLFLFWMNFSWQIIIYGAQLCYGYHNIDSYKI